MPTVDLSRVVTDFRKHYDSMRFQQGRILSEDDLNESIRIDHEDERRSRLDLIGPVGSPDDGFQIKSVKVVNGKAEFDIESGTLYAGGLRFELNDKQTYLSQTDWLQLDPVTVPNNLDPSGRFDLVVFEGWLQPVSFIEDSEFLEKGFNGVDTATHIRLMKRVHLIPGIGSADCQSGWKNWLSTKNSIGSLNNSAEFASDGKLTIEFDSSGSSTNLCSPSIAGGYLGAEHQAIRVQLVDSTSFTWGFDNASPIYRVQLSTDSSGQRRKITMQTEPRDQAHWPLAGQVVELLPWSAVLPNNEKVAELSGFLTTVGASYNPDTKEFMLTDPVLGSFGSNWKNHPDASKFGSEYFFLRVWNRGDDLTSPAKIPFTNGIAVPLGHTGLKATIKGTQFQATDFWIVTVRPETPDVVLPWDFKTGRGPHGYRRFLAPLAVIHWTASGGVVSGQVVDDCRVPFPPITRLRSCCTFTVGDGITSYGHFDSIQDAINHLPMEEGGEICLLPGRFKESIRITNRKQIYIHGCGRRSVVVYPGDTPDSAIRIDDSQNITLRSFAMEVSGSIAIELRDTKDEQKALLEHISLENLSIQVDRYSALVTRGGKKILVRDNRITVTPLTIPLTMNIVQSLKPAVLIRSEEVKVEENEILVSANAIRTFTALGGIQLAGGCQHILIRNNLIRGGNGNGITLGSIIYIRRRRFVLLHQDYREFLKGGIVDRPSFGLTIDENGCIHFDPTPQPPEDSPNDPWVPVSEGSLKDIRILDNEIAEMGLSGIGCARIFSEKDGLITIRELTINGNYIHDCRQVSITGNLLGGILSIGLGGISLSDVERLQICRNRIENNGTRYSDPTCGIWVARGENFTIDENEILENGPPIDPRQMLPGINGGIVIGFARVPLIDLGKEIQRSQYGLPAVQIHGNVVVSPIGPALKMIAFGPVSVQHNQFTSRGIPAPPPRQTAVLSSHLMASNFFLDLFAGRVVTIVNLGVSLELQELAGMYEFMQRATMVPPLLSILLKGYLVENPRPWLGFRVSGNVMFHDNQVILQTALSERNQFPVGTAVFILSLDDVSMQDNQSQCESAFSIFINGFVMGWSARMLSNRFTEPLLATAISGFSYGLMNSTMNNHGTHCILSFGENGRTTHGPNHVLWDFGCDNLQDRLGAILNIPRG